MNGRPSFRFSDLSERARRQHRLLVDKLGPVPGKSLRAMTDYGMNDDEIGRYFKLTPSSVRRLRRAFGAVGAERVAGP